MNKEPKDKQESASLSGTREGDFEDEGACDDDFTDDEEYKPGCMLKYGGRSSNFVFEVEEDGTKYFKRED